LNTVIRVESGVNKNPTIGTLTKIVKALEVGVDEFNKLIYFLKYAKRFLLKTREAFKTKLQIR